MNRRENCWTLQTGVKAGFVHHLAVEFLPSTKSSPIAQDLLRITPDTPDASFHTQQVPKTSFFLPETESHPETYRCQQQGCVQGGPVHDCPAEKKKPGRFPRIHFRPGKDLRNPRRRLIPACGRPGRDLGTPRKIVDTAAGAETAKESLEEIGAKILPPQAFKLLPERITSG